MTLGFSVETLVPKVPGNGALRMGLVRLAESEWLWRDFDRAGRVRTFSAHPESVRTLPGSEAASHEAAALICADGNLAAAALACWEDLCLLQPDADGAYRLTAAAVAFPTDWRLDEKMGLPLTAIHAPIHGYSEQLAAGVDHFFATLNAGAIFGRSNWFVVASGALRYLPTDAPAERFAHVNADNAGRTLFIRCERQTLRRLPLSGAVLFTIGIAVEPLGALSTATVLRVAESVATVREGEHVRRAAPHYADALALYALGRADDIVETIQ